MSDAEWLEHFWGEILSEDAERTQTAFGELDDEDEQRSIYQHLQKMATEDGWAEVQQAAAKAALAALADFHSQFSQD